MYERVLSQLADSVIGVLDHTVHIRKLDITRSASRLCVQGSTSQLFLDGFKWCREVIARRQVQVCVGCRSHKKLASFRGTHKR